MTEVVLAPSLRLEMLTEQRRALAGFRLSHMSAPLEQRIEHMKHVVDLERRIASAKNAAVFRVLINPSRDEDVIYLKYLAQTDSLVVVYGLWDNMFYALRLNREIYAYIAPMTLGTTAFHDEVRRMASAA